MRVPDYVNNRNLLHRRLLETKFATLAPELEAQSRSTFASLKELFAKAKPSRFAAGREKVLREEFLDKVLHQVGWAFSSEGGILGVGTRPDYSLFLTEEAKEAALSRAASLDFFADAAALCEAKPWAVPLFSKGKDEGPSPRGQIYGYLEATHKRWGIVTNGKQWMLICRDYSRAQQRDFMCDLEDALGTPEWTPAFNFFFLAFSQPAFATGVLDRAMAESKTSGELGYEQLKTNIFTALQVLGQGLQRAQPRLFGTPAGRDKAKQNCLILLYRLLFISYAESRGLFPMNEGDHYRRAISLLRIKESIAEQAPSMRPGEYAKIPAAGNRYLFNLRRLFRAIDQGFPLAGLAPYNGGLFRAEENPFLEKLELDDQTIALVVDLMSRSQTEPTTFFDYSYLGVRELGSIYEGLLEFNFQVATAELTILSTGKLKPAAEATPVEKRRSTGSFPAGIVYLANDRGERKATGSYFTPHNVVMQIVRQTLGPVIDAHLAKAKEDGQEPEVALLAIKVLDPAMGSGHFLVGATDFLAERLIGLVEAKLGHESDPAGGEELEVWAKRQIVSHCIYGVDLNPMSVELAKVSLWLSTFSRHHPLSFLDHRLKHGNSLIGTFVADLPIFPPELGKTAARQATLGKKQARFETSGLVEKLKGRISQIEGIADDSLTAVERKKEIYEKLVQSEEYQRLRLLANVYVSLYFLGENPGEDRQKQWDPLVHTVLTADLTTWSDKLSTGWTKDGLRIVALHFPFHWDLEFPEVFSRNNPGFDAVVGNPPYVRAESANKEQRQYLMTSARYETIYGRFDIYAAFLELATKLSRTEGSSGLIVPATVLTIDYATRLREFLLRKRTIASVTDFRGHRVFRDASVDTVILTVNHTPPQPNHEIAYLRPVDETLDRYREIHRIRQDAFLQFENQVFKVEIHPRLHSLKTRVEHGTVRLGRICYCITGVVAHDSETGQSKDRLIHATKIDDTCKPYIEAKEWEGRYSPVAARRFIQYKPAEMHRPKFPELFESPKILIQRIMTGHQIPATFDDSGVYCNHSLNCCVKLESVIHHGTKLHLDEPDVVPDPRYDLKFVLALLSSRLLGVYHAYFISGEMDIHPETVRYLPIREVQFDSKSNRFPARTELLRAALTDPKSVLDHVEALYADSENAKKVPLGVHDLLVDLANRMLELHGERRKLKDAFLQWLESPLGLAKPLESLRNRKKLAHFDEDPEFGAPKSRAVLENVFAENGIKMTATALAEFRTEYDSVHAKLAPVKENLLRTDAVLDRIIYRVYELTPAEIQAVESSA